jgi:DNA-directed RNA polymerase subunit M/transcription elongation factor TFIIS
MALAILDTNTACPACDHHGAWAQTRASRSRTVEVFRCDECGAEWSEAR